MAESKAKKGKKSIDDFADDLDAMLGEVEPGQQIGEIDDDDAIDRLLMGDAFEKDKPGLDGSDDDIDRLLEQNGVYDRKAAPADDGFTDDIDDIISGFDLNPKQQSTSLPADVEVVAGSAVADEIDEFADDDFGEAEISAAQPVVAEAKFDDSEQMTEIDEFADLPAGAALAQDDFLLADFNISADDDVDISRAQLETAAETAEVASEPDEQPAWPEEPEEPIGAVESVAVEVAEAAGQDQFDDDVDLVLSPTEEVVAAIEPAEAEPVISESIEDLPPIAPVVAAPTVQIDHSVELAALTSKITGLKKLLEQARHDLETKVDRETMSASQEIIESLQTETKKNKRNFEALINKKPIGVYAANGVAALAVLVAAGLWIDSFITKSQVGQLVEIVGQLKQQVESAPTADAAEKELFRKQLDDLTVQQTVVNTQLAELAKAVQGDGQKPAGDLGKQLSELSNQDMQMGAVIEALQHKVAALEKGKAVALAPKPVIKKEPVAENWAVNLIAFKQDWYAKRKAEEFAGKGVPAKVSRTDSKGEAWYRLSVDGFSSQSEATAYAAKVKKTLNLDSVWVAKNKD